MYAFHSGEWFSYGASVSIRTFQAILNLLTNPLYQSSSDSLAL